MFCADDEGSQQKTFQSFQSQWFRRIEKQSGRYSPGEQDALTQYLVKSRGCEIQF